ncbi:alpha-N-acetylglucosaminidase TIM-barrel domain-containing protein [Flavobacterium sp. ZS1P14]|uniref:alpha-N-acetylglucosaminidase n=1 Tax=Flavobacterium sp. ZS1P14 TaxID=3401729 RepID=UPI003AAB9B28
MKTRFGFLLSFVVFCSPLQSLQAQDFSGVIGLTERVSPWTKGKIVFHSLAASANDRFELLTQNKQLHISATSASAAAMGFNYYLNNFCNQSVSHGAQNLKPLSALPEVTEKRVIETPFGYRYALNYCTYNYSMSFYQWKDWEKELDWMALHGVNLMLAINGTEMVWQKTLAQFGFSDKEIKDFIPGPAYTAWWLMGNLEGWGGPVSNAMIDRQMELQKKMLARMKELGIEPILQGFYGMVPSTLQSKFPSAKIVEQGKWAGGFQRPAMLSPQDSLFAKMAAVYYQNVKDIYGGCAFFEGDPFHEGGSSKGLDVSLSAKNIQKQMQSIFPNSTWVLQGWGGNPRKELLKDLQKDTVLVVDLFGENQNNWETSNAYNGTPWIWCSVNNFGEKPGLYGKLQRVIEEPHRALQTPQGHYMKGIGIIPEGILNNPLLYDLSLNSAWGNPINTDSLLHGYAKYRYGKENIDVSHGLLSLKKSVYGSHTGYQEGCTESLFSARPAKKIESVSSWGTRKLFYDNRILEAGLQSFLKASDTFKNSETFQYDITDIARQVVANRGQMAYDSLMKSFGQKNSIGYNRYKKEFLRLMQFQEKLMATNKNFLLGTWIRQAKDFGRTGYEKQLVEKNARMQITFWGPDTNPKTDLHEYAHKEWSGLIKDLYEPRWQLFFEQLDNELAGRPFREVDFFALESKWAREQHAYATIPKGNYLEVIQEIVAFCKIE